MKTKWVKSRKGKGVKCRLVAQEYANDRRGDLYAGTPPLALMRYLLSSAMSHGLGSARQKVVVIDVRRAFLHGEATREIYIELPKEDAVTLQGDYVGCLRKTVYGTRDARLGWQKVVQKFMLLKGFTASAFAPGIYYNREMDLKVISHVDDFLTLGNGDGVMWFKDELEKEYEVKSQVLGWGRGDAQETTFSGRKIRRTFSGLEVEGDSKHLVILLKEWGLENGRPVETLLIRHGALEDAEEMESADATRYRRGAARVSYMSRERPDLSFAAGHLAARMAQPRKGDEVMLKRVSRYLLHRPSCPLLLPFQEPVKVIRLFSDSDWANDEVSRRSTSGGIAMKGHHSIHWWSRKQARIALSSCEAEINALVKSAGEGIFLSGNSHLFGEGSSVVLLTDSSAANCVSMRIGTGKTKHLSTKQLWIQEVVGDGRACIQKIPREENPSDALTHEWSGRDIRFFRDAGFGNCHATTTSDGRTAGGC